MALAQVVKVVGHVISVVTQEPAVPKHCLHLSEYPEREQNERETFNYFHL